jgi:DNA polymerase III, epsilon subunit and related 3''-5'' exonucleases
MTHFVAIDFETANQHRSSICSSIGAVVVENAIVTKRFYELVLPTPNFYCQWATNIHGLTFWDTCHARVFPEIWGDLMASISGLPLVAHNSAFEKSCLASAFGIHGMGVSDHKLYCTYRQAQRVLPTLPNHKLPTVAKHLGVPLDAHHNALADAEVCAQIAAKIF